MSVRYCVWVVGLTLGYMMMTTGVYWFFVQRCKRKMMGEVVKYLDEVLTSETKHYRDGILGKIKRRYEKITDKGVKYWEKKDKKEAIKKLTLAFLGTLFLNWLEYLMLHSLKENGFKFCLIIIFCLIVIFIYAMVKWRKKRYFMYWMAFLVGPIVGFTFLLPSFLSKYVDICFAFIATNIELIGMATVGLYFEVEDKWERREVKIKKRIQMLFSLNK